MLTKNDPQEIVSEKGKAETSECTVLPYTHFQIKNNSQRIDEKLVEVGEDFTRRGCLTWGSRGRQERRRKSVSGGTNSMGLHWRRRRHQPRWSSVRRPCPPPHTGLLGYTRLQSSNLLGPPVSSPPQSHCSRATQRLTLCLPAPSLDLRASFPELDSSGQNNPQAPLALYPPWSPWEVSPGPAQALAILSAGLGGLQAFSVPGEFRHWHRVGSGGGNGRAG